MYIKVERYDPFLKNHYMGGYRPGKINLKMRIKNLTEQPRYSEKKLFIRVCMSN